MDTATILQLNEAARVQGRSLQRRRYVCQSILDDTGKHQIGLVGPRGSGKTVILKQLLVHFPDLQVGFSPSRLMSQTFYRSWETSLIKSLPATFP